MYLVCRLSRYTEEGIEEFEEIVEIESNMIGCLIKFLDQYESGEALIVEPTVLFHCLRAEDKYVILNEQSTFKLYIYYENTITDKFNRTIALEVKVITLHSKIKSISCVFFKVKDKWFFGKVIELEVSKTIIQKPIEFTKDLMRKSIEEFVEFVRKL